MSVCDWNELERIFSSAAELEAADRHRYIAEECGDNNVLSREVCSLLSSLESNADFLSDPVSELSLQVIHGTSNGSLIGKEVGNYHIEKKLGEGGMGDVYLAQDKRLRRPVALKLLADPVLDDGWAKRQVIKEARAAAMLEHPNICPIYGVEEIDGQQIIVMQYLKGETLSARLRKGLIRDDELVPLAKQIIDALAFAHENGVVHCDVKPGNIMISEDGHVRVLDFGLAKVLDRQSSFTGEQSLASQNGLIQGTIGYMSPEQLKGERVDRRSDIFSFGTVLFEICTSINPFIQKSDAETISAILSDQSPVNSELGSKIPPRFKHIIRKCLEPQKIRRYQSAHELLLEFENHRPLQGRSMGPILVGTAILFLILAIGGFALYFKSPHVYTATIVPFKNETADSSFDEMADVITEGMIAKLSGSERLKMTPFTMVSGLSAASNDYMSLGRATGSQLILTGKLLRRDNETIIQASLFDADRGVTIRSWEDNVEPDTILGYENTLSSRLISLLSIDSRGFAENRHRGSTTENDEAFRQYWNGRYYWKIRDKQNLRLVVSE